MDYTFEAAPKGACHTGMPGGYKIREIRKNEYPILTEFLYEAIFIPEGVDKPPKSIIEQPELQVYIEDFGWVEITESVNNKKEAVKLAQEFLKYR